MIVLHGLWLDNALHIWAENSAQWGQRVIGAALDFSKPRPRQHLFCCATEQLVDIITSRSANGEACDYELGTLTIALPTNTAGPLPSPGLSFAQPDSADTNRHIFPWKVAAVCLSADLACDWLLGIYHSDSGVDNSSGEVVKLGDSLQFLATVASFGLEFLARGRVLPTVNQRTSGYLEARWVPVIAGDALPRIRQLTASMPPLCRAAWSKARKSPLGDTGVVRSLLETVVDTVARKAIAPILSGSFRSRNSVLVPWLDALTADNGILSFDRFSQLRELSVQLDAWHASAHSASQAVRTCFRLIPPLNTMPEDRGESDDEQMSEQEHDELESHEPESHEQPEPQWFLQVLMQSVADPSLLVEAGQIWSQDQEFFPDSPIPTTEALLRDLGRAARLYPDIDRMLNSAHPDVLPLDTVGAADFLLNTAEVLSQAGFGMLLPSWWGSKRARLKARLEVKSSSSSSSPSVKIMGLDSLVDYDWKISLGDEQMSEQELRQLVELKQPLVQIRGEWVYLNDTDLAAALAIATGSTSTANSALLPGEMTAGQALKIALGVEDGGIGLPVSGMTADGWLGELLSTGDDRVETADNPVDFAGQLRPYQCRGLGWLNFHQRLGLGACLADDMGLGKTAQLLALVVAEKSPGPTLIVCPMSLVGNWQREAGKFAPTLSVHVHHGTDRIAGDDFIAQATSSDLVITTFQLALRDNALLQQVKWHRVVLDEAQNIKNAKARQTKAVRALAAPHRIALTGTPVENTLSELWSIMEFLNPGMLGSAAAFRRNFTIPIERDRDELIAKKLKRITGPFVLRRLKTDRSIITDLPEKMEITAYCNLTREQASLYQAVVDDMLFRIDNSEGIERQGLVLSAMVRLKQICNHPAQFLSDGSRLNGRSGKLERLEEIVDEVVADGERIIIFTQFAEMGTMLRDHLQQRLASSVAWLHGGVSKKARDAMVEQFQSGEGPAVFLLSLKAGGTGLTLTAANHVVHYDRWWNPAVENQATARAYRIGQHRNVQVRKFVTVGTLEEKIDRMIEYKAELANRIVGTGENWLTQLSTDVLRDVLTLGADAVSGDED